MKKSYCVIYSKYRKFEKPKISYLLEKKILVLSIICRKCNLEECQMKTWIKNFDGKK